MSDLLKHLVIGDILGETSSRFNITWLNNKPAAFFIGLMSHAILDQLDNEYVVNWFNFQELKIALPFLLVQIAFSLFVLGIIYIKRKRKIKNVGLRIYFILGAVIPDIVDGIYSYFNPQAWYNGQLLFPWHVTGEMSIEPMSMYGTIFLSLGLVLIRYTLFGFLLKGRKTDFIKE